MTSTFSRLCSSGCGCGHTDTSVSVTACCCWGACMAWWLTLFKEECDERRAGQRLLPTKPTLAVQRELSLRRRTDALGFLPRDAALLSTAQRPRATGCGCRELCLRDTGTFVVGCQRTLAKSSAATWPAVESSRAGAGIARRGRSLCNVS